MALIVFDVDEGTALFVKERAKALGLDVGAYLLRLIESDQALATKDRRESLSAILAPLHAHAEAMGISDEEIARDVETARREVHEARKASKPRE